MSHFSDTLLSLRRRRGLSQQQLAEGTGLSRSAIGMYETGRREPDMDTLRLFADFFHVEPGDLLAPATQHDEEVEELLEMYRNREEIRMLFKLTRGARPEEIRAAARIIEALRSEEP